MSRTPERAKNADVRKHGKAENEYLRGIDRLLVASQGLASLSVNLAAGRSHQVSMSEPLLSDILSNLAVGLAYHGVDLTEAIDLALSRLEFAHAGA